MSAPNRLPPIPGRVIDPPPPSIAAMTERIEAHSRTAALGYRIGLRFTLANVALLTAGTTYYLLMSMFAVLTLTFGLTTLLGADRLIVLVNNALENFLPGLVGGAGIDPQALQRLGTSTSIGGLFVLLYAAGSSISAANRSLHQIFGAPSDPRNFVVGRLRLTGWMLVIGPLILLSFTPTIVVGFFGQPVAGFLNFGDVGQTLLPWIASLLALVVDFGIVMLMLSVLGGIRPARRPRVIGAALAAVAMAVLKNVMALVVAWSVSKPQYGAFATPITLLLVLYLQTIVLYGAACVVAGLAERQAAADGDRPPETLSAAGAVT